ncbi:lysine N(6)-hydroxylase/L-ornithine N(5)-oxygenase family protein [Puniceibacterium sediminis]|uniref:L-ornithine N5-oxygenase n=1 Tax=Puniceibacterium sediminis TaxID=1608407 RepID=A0A238YVX8_9RHOB|nr:SidA/IucD/PvdA family monooxygenase [Puniceibacterium sediminis]SNR74629.1 L-ornithine N5-oxygenase [Puniceibacterium sediminis]
MKDQYAGHTVDVLGIGFGPSNLSLAVAHEEARSGLNMLFIDGASGPEWQPEMMLQGSDIQNNPLRDLVTPRNPRSYYGFTNYLKEKGRLFEYLNLGLHYPLRKDYAQYVTWVAEHFASIARYETRARNIRMDVDQNLWHVETDSGDIAARALVLGTGRSRKIPKFAEAALGPRVFHASDYLKRMNVLGMNLRSVAVIGASQSAVEITLDLANRLPQAEIHTIHRSFSMRQKDASPFSDYVYFPEFVDYFFRVGDEARENLSRQLRGTNYSAADHDVLHKLMLTLYEERLDRRQRIHIRNNTAVETLVSDANGASLTLKEQHLGDVETLNVDAVILATGFRDLGHGEGDELFPELLADVAPHLARRGGGALKVERDYAVACDAGLALYLNGLCESSHGLGDAGSFSLLSMRSADILASLEAKLIAPSQSHRHPVLAETTDAI